MDDFVNVQINTKKETPALLRKLFVLALPIVGQNLINVSVGLADNLMVGSLGEYAVAGVHLANQVQIILFMLVMGIAATITLLASQYWGKRDISSIKDIVAIGFKIAVSVGLLLNIIVWFNPYGVLRIFSNNEYAIQQGATYLRIIAFSYVFFCITQMLMATMRCIEVVKIAFIVAICTLIISVSLNYMLIFGNFGMPALGIRGAAIGTLSARIVETIVMIVYVRFIDKRLKLRFRDLLKNNRILLGDFIRNGTPIITGDILWGVAMTAQTAIIGRLGASAIASQNVTGVMFQFVTVVIWGTSAACGVIIGKTVGTGNYELVKHYARVMQKVFVFLGVITMIIFFSLREFFLARYNFTPETIVIARQFITIAALSSLFISYAAPCFIGIIRAGGDTKFVLKVDGVCAWLIVLPLSFIAAFVFEFPPHIVYIFLRLDQFFKWIIAFFKTNSFTWIKNLTRTNENDNENNNYKEGAHETNNTIEPELN